MKKLVRIMSLALIIVSLLAIALPAMAASSPCSHSNKTRTYVSPNYYEDWDSTRHVTIWTETWNCNTCGTYNVLYERMFNYTWNSRGDRCVYCLRWK